MRINEVTEARQPNDPDVVSYQDVPLKKKEPNVIDSVVVMVQGQRSRQFTTIARKFARANRIKKLLAAEEKKLKAQTLAGVEDLFDAGEEVYTRVVETASLVFKIAKSGSKTVNKLDQAGYIAELEKLTGLAVDKLEAIQKQHTKVSTTKVLPKVLAPTEKKQPKESVQEGMYSKLKAYFQKFLGIWDNKFDSLKSKIEKAMEFPELSDEFKARYKD